MEYGIYILHGVDLDWQPPQQLRMQLDELMREKTKWALVDTAVTAAP